MKKSEIISISIVVLCLIVGVTAVRLCFTHVAWQDCELLYSGKMAMDIIDGSAQHLLSYRVVPYNNNIIFVGIALIPFYFFLGNSFLSLLIFIILLGICKVVLLYLFALKYFNRNVAAIASFFYIFAPMHFGGNNLRCIGSHTDVALFSLIIFYLFYSLLFSHTNNNLPLDTKNRKKLWIAAIACGLVCGIASFICMTSLMLSGLIVILWLMFSSSVLKKRYLVLYGGAFLIGFMPWLIYNSQHQFQGMYIQACANDTLPIWKYFLVKKALFLETCILLLYQFYSKFTLALEGTAFRHYFSHELLFLIVIISIFYGGFVLVTFTIRRLLKRTDQNRSQTKIAIISIYVYLLLLFYCIHPKYYPEDLYLLPAYPFICLLVGIFIVQLWHLEIYKIKFRMLGIGLLLVVLVGGYYYAQDYNYNGHQFDKRWFTNLTLIKGYSLSPFHLCYREK